ncbi:MAG: hypothetical protein M1825_001380 [Sarcosagium campestre]|nr:MAG: hypothetical protein M1825_001380 [Sarcosagium campestre]
MEKRNPKFLPEELHSRRRNKRIPSDGKDDENMSWLSRTASSHQVQLAATAIVSGALVAGAIYGYQNARRRTLVEDLKGSIPDLDETHEASQLTEFGAASTSSLPPGPSKEDERGAELAARARNGDYDEELILEQLARNRVFLSDAGLSKLRNAFIIVVGCGGVGSHAATALARSGVGKIRLVDFDQVTLSSLNRHAVATLADVGTPKVQCLQRRLQQVTPWVHFDCRNELFRDESAAGLLGPFQDGQKPDGIIDAIDNVDSKVTLLAYCHNHSLPVISSMGAGCKSDPTRILIGDISSSTEDPLSRSTRRRLRALGIDRGIPVVYSTEKSGPGKAQLQELPDDEVARGAVGELGILADFRVRILPVLGTMPASFGYAAANHVILDLTGYPHEYIPGKSRDKMYDGILANLQASEEKLAGATGIDAVGLKIPVTKDDVGYLVEEVYRGRSVLSGVPTKLALVRWRLPAPSSAAAGGPSSTVDTHIPGQKRARLQLGDLVCMTKEEAAAHLNAVLKGGERLQDVYSPDILTLVERRQREEEAYSRFR